MGKTKSSIILKRQDWIDRVVFRANPYGGYYWIVDNGIDGGYELSLSSAKRKAKRTIKLLNKGYRIIR